jgi:multiple sugar transport system permease protein
VLGATRTAFLIPMVLPPIVVALIWKILYTPDVSPLHRALPRPWACRSLR